jgi:phosphoglycolate phosphatase-like HAD superfamily hydrolase
MVNGFFALDYWARRCHRAGKRGEFDQVQRKTLKPQTSIFFDLDGTLCDPREGIVRCLQYALEQMGHAAPPGEQLICYIGPPLYESFTALLNCHDTDLVKRAVELYRARFVYKGMFENTLYPGIPDALRQLTNQDFQLHLVTSKPTAFARQIIDHFGLQKYFRNVHGSEPDGTRSDKRELIASSNKSNLLARRRNDRRSRARHQRRDCEWSLSNQRAVGLRLQRGTYASGRSSAIRVDRVSREALSLCISRRMTARICQVS